MRAEWGIDEPLPCTHAGDIVGLVACPCGLRETQLCGYHCHWLGPSTQLVCLACNEDAELVAWLYPTGILSSAGWKFPPSGNASAT